MNKHLKQTLILGALAGAAVALLEPKKKGVAGLGDVDTSSPEYSAWYYNVYLPSVRRQGSMYQPGWNYRPYYQPQANNPYAYLQSQYYEGMPYSTQAQDQCLISGGKWQDTGRGFICSGGGVVPSTYSPYVSNPYTSNPYNPYVNPYAQYGGGPQACSAQGGFWDSFTGQCTR